MLIDIAVANPPFKVFQPRAAEELKERMAGGAAVGRMIDIAAVHSGIDSRFISIPDAEKIQMKNFTRKRVFILNLIPRPE